MNIKTKIVTGLILFLALNTNAQAKKKFPIALTGAMGVTYEGYGLSVKPTGSGIYSARRLENPVNVTTLIRSKLTTPIRSKLTRQIRCKLTTP